MGVGNRISKTASTQAPADPFRRSPSRASYPRRITLDLDDARYQWLRAVAYEARVPAAALLRAALDVLAADPKRRDAVITAAQADRIDDEAQTLARLVREIVPAKASSSFQLIADALFRPIGMVVSGMVLRRGDASADRIGVALDVKALPGSGVIRFPLRLAIELWAYGLRAAVKRIDRNRQLGLVANLAGGLFQGSTLAYAEHDEVFTLLAIGRFREATRLLPRYYKPAENLAVACRDYAATPAGRADAEYWYQQAEKS